MRKKFNVKLLFLALLTTFSICSCVREDLLQQEIQKETASVSSAKYASRSLWKEDDVYIGKVQQVFLKHANLEKVKETYGELYWNYAMSFGQFGEKYLLVPIVKKDKVVLLMEAVRKGDRLYFYEKNDADLLTFFQHVLFSNIISHSEVIDGNEVAAKAKYVCSTRTIVIGCLNGQTDCEPVSYSHMVCEWKEGGGNGIPPKSFDPLGDPFGGGGGGGGSDGYEYPDPPEETTPCEKIQKIGNDNKTKSLMSTLKGKTNLSSEYGYILNKENNETPVQGLPGEEEIKVNVNASTPINGFIHSHYSGLLSVFSPYDIFTIAQLYKQGLIDDMNSFIMGVVTASDTQYIMVIDDPVKFGAFADNLFDGNSFDEVVIKNYEYAYQLFGISENNTVINNEKGFYNYLETNNTGLKILKGDNNMQNWGIVTKNSNGNIIIQNCNN